MGGPWARDCSGDFKYQTCFPAMSLGQGLTLVHISAQLEPCLTHKISLHALNTTLAWATNPLRAPPIPQKALKLS